MQYTKFQFTDDQGRQFGCKPHEGTMWLFIKEPGVWRPVYRLDDNLLNIYQARAINQNPNGNTI